MKTAKENLQEAIRLIDKYESNPQFSEVLAIVVELFCGLAVKKLSDRSAFTANSSEHIIDRIQSS